MIRENGALGAALLALMVGAYMSWHHEPDAPDDTTVRLLDLELDELDAVRLTGPTATVAVSFFDHEGRRRAWLELERGPHERAFVGNPAFMKALEELAGLEALRSLGRLDADAVASAGLDAPKRRLELRARDTTHALELGGRTNGARDFYARRPGEAEVFLLRGRTITDLEAPEARYMQRRVRAARLRDVGGLNLTAGERSREAIHKNRLSPGDAYWAWADAPDTVAEALGSWITKLERLSVQDFLTEPERFEAATPVLRVRWTDPEGETLDTLELRELSVGERTEWLARSKALGRPARMPRGTAEQLARDLEVVLGD